MHRDTPVNSGGIPYNRIMPNQPVLYIVATPIGDPGDITLRAVETLTAVDLVICEEPKQGRALLSRLNIPQKKLVELNEHNEAEQVPELIKEMLIHTLSAALISDCGTPVFSDPGTLLIQQAVEMGIRVSPVPGASSLIAALSVADRPLKQFYFGGFLSRVPEDRRKELSRLRSLRVPLILMDTPYRMAALLEDVAKTFGKGAPVTLACDLTLPAEKVYRGSAGEVLLQIQRKKAEFILIVY